MPGGTSVERISAAAARALADLLRHLPVALIATDRDGRVFAWTPHATRLYGWPAERAIGAEIWDLTVGPREASVAEAIMARIVSGGVWEGVFSAVRADGTEIEVHVIDVPLIGEDGAVEGVLGLSVERSATAPWMSGALGPALGSPGRRPAERGGASAPPVGDRDVERPQLADPAPAPSLEDLIAATAHRLGIPAEIRVAHGPATRAVPATEILVAAEAALLATSGATGGTGVRLEIGMEAAVPRIVGAPARPSAPATRARRGPVHALLVASGELEPGLLARIRAIPGLTLVPAVPDAQATGPGHGPQPRVILLDGRLATRAADRTLDTLQEAHPGTGIIVLGGRRPVRRLATLARQGVRGLVSGDAPVEALAAAIGAVADGRAWFSLPPVDPEGLARRLSPREREILALLLQGERVGVIATRLGIDIRTVSSHKARIQAKLGVDSTAALIVRAMELGLG